MTSTELITCGSYKTPDEYLASEKITPETRRWTMIYLNKFHINVPESELDSVPEWNASQFTWGCNVKANKRADQRLDYKFKRDEENAKVRDEQHNMNIMKTQLDANTLMLDRAQASYMMKKWPYGKMATHKRYEEEKQEWRDSDIHETIDKIYAFGSLYSKAALRAVRIHQTIKNSEKGFEDEKAEAAPLRKISRFQYINICCFT